MGATDQTAVRRIAGLEDVGLDDLDEAGGTGAHLGELAGSGFPVPPGFVILASAYRRAMDEAGCRAALRADLDEARAADDPAERSRRAGALRTRVRRAGIPPDLADEIEEALARLGADAPVVVRASAPDHDAEGGSRVDRHGRTGPVVGVGAVLGRVLDCWISLFGDRAVARHAAGDLGGEPSIAVVVQRAVAPERHGIVITADPSTGGGGDVIVVEGSWGPGGALVCGSVEPDTYRIDAATLAVTDVRAGSSNQWVAAAGAGGGLTGRPPDRDRSRVLSDVEAVELARLGIEVARHHRRPMVLQWAMAGGTTWLVRARPATGAPPGPGARRSR